MQHICVKLILMSPNLSYFILLPLKCVVVSLKFTSRRCGPPPPSEIFQGVFLELVILG